MGVEAESSLVHHAFDEQRVIERPLMLIHGRPRTRLGGLAGHRRAGRGVEKAVLIAEDDRPKRRRQPARRQHPLAQRSCQRCRRVQDGEDLLERVDHLRVATRAAGGSRMFLSASPTGGQRAHHHVHACLILPTGHSDDILYGKRGGRLTASGLQKDKSQKRTLEHRAFVLCMYSRYPILLAHPNHQILRFVLTRRVRPFPLQETH